MYQSALVSAEHAREEAHVVVGDEDSVIPRYCVYDPLLCRSAS